VFPSSNIAGLIAAMSSQYLLSSSQTRSQTRTPDQLTRTQPAKLFKKKAGQTESEDDITYGEFLMVLLRDASGSPATLWEEANECLNNLDLKQEATQRWHRVITQSMRERETGRVTDVLAQLIFLAPKVAAVLLDMTLNDETEKEENKFLDFTGVFLNDPMRCKYQTVDRVKPPSRGWFAWMYAKVNNTWGWNYEAGANDLCRDADTSNSNPSDQNPNVLQITKYRCVLPNILDLDIIQALCITQWVSIFAKKSVQALLYCTWRSLMVHVVTVKVGLSAIEMLTLFFWGMTTADGSLLDRLLWTTEHDPTDPEWLLNHTGHSNSYQQGSRWDHIYAFDSSSNARCKWNILAAMSLRQVFNLCWNFIAFQQRRRNAEQRYCQRKALFGYLRRVWGYGIYIFTIVDQQLAQLLVRCLFLFLTFGTPDAVMSSTQQAMLSATFFMSVMSIFQYVRVISSKVSLSRMAMRKAIEDTEVTHFLFLVASLFTIFILSWEIIDRQSTFSGAMTQAFRGLVIGDGDGLDFLGQKTDDETEESEEAHKFKLVAGTVALIVFFTYLMNLVIAIFGSTYESAQKSVWLHFHQVRARLLRDTILSCHLFAFFNAPSPSELFTVSMCLCLGGFFLQLLVGFVTVSFIHVPASFISILMMAAGAVLLEAWPFVRLMENGQEYDWFPWKDDSPKRHFLHVWCRSDYDEDLFLGTGEMEKKYYAMQNALSEIQLAVMGLDEKTLEQHAVIKKQVEALDGRFDALGHQMTELLDKIAKRETRPR
jgi:hypothetical protein